MPSFEHLEQVQDVYSVLESLHPLHLNISELSVTTQNAMLKNRNKKIMNWKIILKSVFNV